MLIGAIKSYENLFTNKTKNMETFNKLAEKGSNLSEKEQRILAEISLRLMYAPGEQTRIDADIFIENYRADKIRLTNEMQEGRKFLSNLKNQLENLISKRKSRPIEHAFEKLLAKYGIIYQQHFTMTLIGEHCHRWLVHHEEILSELRNLIIEGLENKTHGLENKSEEEKNAIILGVDNLIFSMQDLMSMLDFIISVMREQKYHNDEECETFQKACEYLGMKWREYGLSPTPKVHSLERHVPEFMWRYRRLFAEDSIERGHAINNRFNRVLACINRWEHKVRIREDRIGALQINTVAEAVALSVKSTARIFSPEVIEKKRAASDSKDKKSNENRKKTREKLISSVSTV
jgi:hypothetical protein